MSMNISKELVGINGDGDHDSDIEVIEEIHVQSPRKPAVPPPCRKKIPVKPKRRPPGKPASAKSPRKKPSRVIVPKSSSENEDEPVDDRNGSSGSQDDKSISGSATSSTEESEDDVSPPKREPAKYDDDNDLIIPLDCDNYNSEHPVELNDNEEMCCNVCESIFFNRVRYLIHRRRHFAQDHFVCPTCFKGFVNLTLCQQHELKEHFGESDPNEKEVEIPKAYSFRKTTLRKTEIDTLKATKQNIVPSTSLYPYVGPEVDDPYRPYEIELKYANVARKGTTRLESERILILHKRAKERTLARLLAANRKFESMTIFEAERKKENASQKGKKLGVSSKGPPDKMSQANVLPQIHRSRKLPDIIAPDRKYFCSICGWNASSKASLKTHIDDLHPSLQVDDVMDYCSANALPVEESESERNARERKENRRKQNPKERKRKVRFAVRREAVRVWERAFDSLRQAEFMSALGMIKKSDVLLGERQGVRAMESSNFSFRRIRREKSPDPKTVVIVMKKLPKVERKHVHLCDLCEFFDSSQKEVRRHRRNEHLKKLDDDDQRASSAPKIKYNSLANKTQTKPEDSATLPPAAVDFVTSASVKDDEDDSDSDEVILYQCSRCEFSSESKIEVKLHKKEKHKAGSSSSSSGISTFSTTNSHSSSSSKVTLINVDHTSSSCLHKCNFCDFTSYLQYEVQYHEKTKHGLKSKNGLTNSDSSSSKISKTFTHNSHQNEIFRSPPAKRSKVN